MRRIIAGLLVLLFFISFLALPAKPVAGVEPAENYWVSKAPIVDARSDFGIAVVNGKIYAIGGQGYNGVLSSNEEYDPASDKWIRKQPMPTPRSDFGIAVYQNKIYCIGGRAYTYTDVNEVYDPATDTWETKAALPSPVDLLSANTVNGVIYVVSGYFDWGANMTSNMNLAYDPANDSWTTKNSPPQRITSGLTAVDGMIYYAGYRMTNDPESPTEEVVEAYDTETGGWKIRPYPFYRVRGPAGATTGVHGPKKIYIFDPDETHVYDPASDSWAIGSPLPTSRASPGVAVIDETFYVVGGSELHETYPFWTYTYFWANEMYTPFLFGTVPDVSFVSPRNTTYAEPDISLNVTVSQVTSWMGFSLDGHSNVTLTGNRTVVALSEGEHFLSVYASNFAGDVISLASVHFAVDLSPPQILVSSPENRSYPATDVPLIFMENESVARVVYSLDGRGNLTVTGNTTLSGLSLGPHNVTVHAWDAAGNVGASETISFSVAEPFPTVLVLAVAVVAIILVGVGCLLYKKRGRGKTQMKKTTIQITIIIALSFSLLVATQSTNSAVAQPRIDVTIRTDGSIDPPTAPITRIGNTYKLTSDITGSITVEKFNIIVDGAGYSLQGNGTGIGIQIFNPYNSTVVSSYDVTVKRLAVEGFEEGIDVFGYWGNVISGVSITENNLSNNGVGVRFSSYFAFSDNRIVNNRITENGIGISFQMAQEGGDGKGNLINQNLIADNDVGMHFVWMYSIGYETNLMNNTIFGNDFVHNSQNIQNEQMIFSPESVNIWDNGSVGNYWSNYKGADSDHDGIGDTPYVIDEHNQDNCPLMIPFGESPTPAPSREPTTEPERLPTTLVIGSVIVVVAVLGLGLLVYLKKRRKGKTQ